MLISSLLHRSVPALLAGLVTLSAGCGLADLGTAPSVGEEGEVELAWAGGVLGCLFGCDAADPMVAGGRAYLSVVNDDDLPAFTVESEDPAVVSAAAEGGSIVLDAAGPGEARIVFRDAQRGEVFDRFTIKVRDVAAIELSDDFHGDEEELAVMVGGDARIHLDLRDAADHHLQGIGGVSYTLSDELSEEEVNLIEAIAEAIAGIFGGLNNEGVAVEAIAVGSGSILVEAPSGAARTIPVRVVDAAAITRVELRGGDEGPTIGEPYNVDAAA
ncbi:MAG: hypothetical protein KC420_19780, partial [Myxococcales bacterium]|nr:hypothetical protein [Myxococcales bacterium]